MSLLSLDQVSVSIHGTPILKNISLAINSGETLGVIGESGSGKSMTALTIMGLLPGGAEQTGQIVFGDQQLQQLPEAALCRIRGDNISMVFQEPMTALNPLHTIGAQVMECIQLHQDLDDRSARTLTQEVLERCGLPTSKFPLNRYPHELSGGQRQRVVIAMAVALKPTLLIADEPTTALDVTTQAEILTLLRDLQQTEDIALMLVSHDLAVVADMADRLIIMNQGEIVDSGTRNEIFRQSTHPYTQQLIAASSHAPDRHATDEPAASAPLLSVSNLVCEYPVSRTSLFAPREYFRAVDQVSFSIANGESIGLVGESGCGKSTLTRALLGLEPIREGTVSVNGRSVTNKTGVALETRRDMQVVFQDPYGSFNPRHKVERMVAEPLFALPTKHTAAEKLDLVHSMLEDVGLSASDSKKYIHEFSGGQRQRIAIARALVMRPKLIILDEAVSALDVSVRARILDLLTELAQAHGLAYLFISHDLSVVRNITDRVLVMQNGQFVETGITHEVFDHPAHEYTRRLIRSAPSLEPHLPSYIS